MREMEKGGGGNRKDEESEGCSVGNRDESCHRALCALFV